MILSKLGINQNLMITYGNLLDECNDLSIETGCNPADSYHRDFLTRISSGIAMMVARRLDVPCSDREHPLPVDTEIDGKLILDIQNVFETIMEEEVTVALFSELLNGYDKTLLRTLILTSDRLSRNELIDYIKRSNLINAVQLTSPLHSLLQAILEREDIITVMQKLIREKDIKTNPDDIVKRPPQITAFIDRFRSMLARHLSSQAVFAHAVVHGNVSFDQTAES